MMSDDPISVLLIEDNPGDGRLIREALHEASRDFDVHETDRLASGLERLAKGDIHVVLLDLSLPDASGLETFQKVFAGAKDAAIIVLTGLDDDQMAVAAVNAGAQDYLTKSRIDPEVLQRAIRYSIERHRLVTQLRKLDALKSQFIADAAHELRTPLTTLAGFAEMLGSQGDQMTEKQRADALAHIGRQSHHVAALVSNLLDLSQIDAGKLTVDIRDVHLAHAAARAIGIAGTPAGYNVHVDIGDELCVLADPSRLDQVLVNLLTNAFRYGGKNVRIEGGIEDRETILTVSDDGEGVPPDLAETLFDPFARGSNAGKVKGSGLGLAIVRKLILAMNGDVWYEGSAGKGAAFRMRLPTA